MAIGNDVYVEDEPDAIATMTQLFMRLDRAATQILIEARVIEASPSLVKALELQWKGDKTEPSQAMTDADGEVESKSRPASLSFDFISKDKSLTLGAQIMADENSGGSQIISAPRIMAANDQKVNIKQGQRRHCFGSAPRSTAANVQFRENMIEITFVPHIEKDGQSLTLDLQLANDTPNLAEPFTNVKEAGIKLLVKDGETIVIGGIIMEGDQGSEGHMPQGRRYSLSDWLLRDHSNESTEVLIFVTANIIQIDI